MKVMYTGTFNPWHRGHQNIYDQACAIFGKKNVHVVLAKHPTKDVNMEYLKRCLHAALIPRDNVHINKGLTQDFCKAKGFEAIIRGLRSTEDCSSEFTMADWNDEIQTIFLYCNDPSLRKLSSSAIKEVERHNPGSTKKYFSKFFQYYRWKLPQQRPLKFILFGKIASGKSHYLRKMVKDGTCYESDIVDLDKEIWNGFTDKEISYYKRTIKDCIILNDSSRYESQLIEMNKKINWEKLLSATYIEASVIGNWIRFIPDEVLAPYVLVKIESKSKKIRAERLKKRGLLDHQVKQFDKFYEDPPFYDEIRRV